MTGIARSCHLPASKMARTAPLWGRAVGRKQGSRPLLRAGVEITSQLHVPGTPIRYQASG
jgi:hypothetical protein